MSLALRIFLSLRLCRFRVCPVCCTSTNVLFPGAMDEEVPASQPLHLCYICNKGFSTSTNLNKHIRNIHHEQPPSIQKRLKCPLCDQNNPTTESLASHLHDLHTITLDIEHNIFLSEDGKFLTN